MNPDETLTPHFKLKEFLVNEPKVPDEDELANLKRTAEALEKIRTLMGGRPIKILSGLRSPEHNRRVGGAKHSFHIVGMAADIIVVGVPPSEVQWILRDWDGGLGSYKTWTHVDIGPRRRWRGM